MFGQLTTSDSSTEALLLPYAESRGYLDCISGFFRAYCRDVIHRRERQNNPLAGRARELFPTLDETRMAYPIPEWGHSEILVVLIHGLNSSPLSFTSYLQPLRRSGATIFAPNVYKKGYCPVMTAALPILHVVQAYAKQFPHNTIFLVGHSKGADIAARIERKLGAHCVIRLISIGGPHGGAKCLNWTPQLVLTRSFGITPELAEENVYMGEYTVRQLRTWQTLKYRNIERLFFASQDDWIIFPYNTCFPRLPHSTYRLIEGESHASLVEGVCQEVLAYIAQQTHLR